MWGVRCMNNNLTKQKIVEAASSLFFQKGFKGTTVRDIAGKASVNVSLISYYFENKQGLLEYTVTNYYEAYLKALGNTFKKSQLLSQLEVLKNLIITIINYKHTHYELACFIHRELSFDSIFVREMAVTYIAKENFLISRPLFHVIKKGSRQSRNRQLYFIQLKGMLMAPYFSYDKPESRHVSDYSHDYFVKSYVEMIHNWLDFVVLQVKTL